MYNWKVEPEFLTLGGHPKQYYSLYGEAFVVSATRVSGPSDDEVPRRVIADGTTRAAAWAALHKTLGTYDTTYRLLPLTQQRAERV